jgi:hypothetical protein
MPRWKKGAKEYRVPVHYQGEHGAKVNIPKPILDLMNQPKYIKFIIERNNKISLTST